MDGSGSTMSGGRRYGLPAAAHQSFSHLGEGLDWRRGYKRVNSASSGRGPGGGRKETTLTHAVHPTCQPALATAELASPETTCRSSLG